MTFCCPSLPGALAGKSTRDNYLHTGNPNESRVKQYREQQCQAWGRKEQSHWAAHPLGGDAAHMSQARQDLGSEPLEKEDGTSDGLSQSLLCLPQEDQSRC